jgi:hypothetical protein
MAELAGKKEAQVVTVLDHTLFEGIDVKDMVGPAEEERWFRFMDTALMAAYDDVFPWASITKCFIAYEKRDFVRQAGFTDIAGR